MESSSLNKREMLGPLLISVLLSLWAYWLWTRRHLYRYALKHPGVWGYPLIGLIHRIPTVRYLIPAFANIYKECKSYTAHFWLGVYPILMTAEPSFIKDVLSSPELLNKAEQFYRPIEVSLKGGLLSSPEPKWRHHRKLINPSFQHRLIVSLLPIFNRGKNHLISTVATMVNNGEHELGDILTRNSITISVETTMGQELKDGEKESERIVHAFYHSIEITAKECIYSMIGADRILALAAIASKRYLEEFVKKLVSGKFEKMNNLNDQIKNGSNNHDHEKSQADIANNDVDIKKKPNIFIDQAIEIYQKGQFTIDDIIAESNTIVLTSFETSATTLLSALTLLAMHPDVQERLFEEICNTFPQKTFHMGNEHVPQLPYLDMVVNETLRICPSAPIIARQVVKDTQLNEQTCLPKGIQIVIDIFHLHRRTDIWGPDAEKFNPDHFLPENMANIHPYAYIPFSKGIRNCIGWRYALLSVKVLLSGLVRNYRFETDMKFEELECMHGIALKFYKEPRFRIYERI